MSTPDTPDTPTPEQPCGAPGDEEQLRPAITLPLTFPAGLHPDTTSLVLRFATALAKKFRKAEEKYGYSDGWIETEWVETGECAEKLNKHVEKGDPLDVAAYCAFLWHHGTSTKPDTATSALTKERDDLRERLEAAVSSDNFYQDLCITLLDAKWLDPECRKGCQSLVLKGKLDAARSASTAAKEGAT